ncbi:MAG: hypothetical protein ACRC78_02370 [Planktothrix sp.]
MMIQLKQQPPLEIEFVDTISAWGVTRHLPECKSYPKIQQKHDIIRIAIIEDNEETRLNLRKNLRSQPGIEVASEATNAEIGLVLLESMEKLANAVQIIHNQGSYQDPVIAPLILMPITPG